jgi:hypothetical protein
MADFERLFVAHDLDPALESAVLLCKSEVPGFQIDPLAVLKIGYKRLVLEMQTVFCEHFGWDKEFCNDPLDTRFDSLGLFESPVVPPHIDGGKRGIEVHFNHDQQREDGVELAFPNSDIAISSLIAYYFYGPQPTKSIDLPRIEDHPVLEEYTGKGMSDIAESVHGVRVGNLAPGMITVFSGGGYDDLKPSVHYLKRIPGLESHWTRISIMDKPLRATDYDRSNNTLPEGLSVSLTELQTHLATLIGTNETPEIVKS